MSRDIRDQTPFAFTSLAVIMVTALICTRELTFSLSLRRKNRVLATLQSKLLSIACLDLKKSFRSLTPLLSLQLLNIHILHLKNVRTDENNFKGNFMLLVTIKLGMRQITNFPKPFTCSSLKILKRWCNGLQSNMLISPVLDSVNFSPLPC